MPWLPLIGEQDADGLLREIYEKRAVSGKVGAVVKAGCHNPRALAARSELFHALMYREEGLSRAERELVATVTSVANECEY